MSTRVPFRVYVALIVAAVLWGSLYPAAKPAVAAVGPMTVTLCRAALAAVTLGILALTQRGAGFVRLEARRNWRGIIALAVLSFSGSAVLAMLAVGLLPASVNGLLNNTHPLWVAIGSALLYPPRRPALLVGGSAIALLGVALVFFPDLSFGSLVGANALNPLGVALSLAGSGVIALSTAVGRKVMPDNDPITMSALASATAVPLLVVLVLVTDGFGPLLAATPSMLLLLLYLGIGCTAINFSLWYYGLKQLPAARASAFQYLIPPLSVVFSAVFLHESIGVGLALGGAFIVVGLVATQLASQPTAVPTLRPLVAPALEPE